MSQPQTTPEQWAADWAAFRADIAQKTARKPRKPKAPKTVTANDLTRQVVRYLRDHSAFATRLSSTGVYRADLKKYIPSQQVPGIPDIYACVDGHAVHIEVKVGNDKLSEIQKQTIADLRKAGAAVFVAHDLDSFKVWFTAEFLTAPFQ